MNSTLNQKKSVSITVLLATAVGGLIALSVGVVLALTVVANFKNTSELLEIASRQLIGSIEEQIESHVDPAKYVVEHLTGQAKSGAIDLTNKQEMITTLRASLAAAPDLTGVVVFQPDGREIQIRRSTGQRFVVSTSNNTDNVDLTKFLMSLASGNSAGWQAPRRIDGTSFISFSSPVIINGKFAGAISAGISISSLSGALSQIESQTPFTSYILFGKNHVLAHKNLPALSSSDLSVKHPLHRADAINDPVLGKYGSTKLGDGLFAKGEIQARLITVGNVQHVAISKPITHYGMQEWNVGVHGTRHQLTSQLRRMLLSIAIGLGFLVLSVIAAIVLARRVAKPIKTISLAATHIGSLDLGKISTLPNSRISELNNLSMAFNQMLDGLKWFEAYVPRKLVRRLIKEHGEDAVASRQEELTVMFTDLIGFTKMSENLSPPDVGKLLNEHFEVVYSCINKTDGTLDKYIGDAVMAFWGAPETQHDHAMRACEAAMSIAETLAEVDTDLRMKIALHTGPLIVGNIGAQGRMNYTVIGDTVNTCARIEKLAGDLDDGSKVFILLSDQVAQAVKGKFKTEPAGEFSVKGRNAKVIVHRLVSRL